MRYRLLTLIFFVTVTAIVFALIPREPAVVPSLRRDLKIPSRNPIWVLDQSMPNRVVAVTERENRYTLFVAFRGWWDDVRRDEWVIPFVVGSGAPPGQPEAVFEDSVDFDHFPTTDEIARFRREYGIDGHT
ncbi:MAG: hypothetical protein AAF802_19265 [Planctomycetota bacterium]